MAIGEVCRSSYGRPEEEGTGPLVVEAGRKTALLVSGDYLYDK
jgi:hypothetical protein